MEHVQPRRPCHRRESRVRNVLRQAEIDVEPQPRRDLIVKELTETAPKRIDSSQELAFIEAKGDRVIGLPGTRFPGRLLSREHDSESIEVADQAARHRLVEDVQSSLVCQQLPDGDSVLAVLRELRPVRGYSLFVVEPAAGMRNRKRHRRQALGGRVDDHHGVLLPWLAGLFVSHAAPEVDDLRAMDVGGACAAQLPASCEVFTERFAHALEAGIDVSFHVLTVFDSHGPSRDWRRASWPRFTVRSRTARVMLRASSSTRAGGCDASTWCQASGPGPSAICARITSAVASEASNWRPAIRSRSNTSGAFSHKPTNDRPAARAMRSIALRCARSRKTASTTTACSLAMTALARAISVS